MSVRERAEHLITLADKPTQDTNLVAAMNTALRDCLHESDVTKCSVWSDTCNDWPLAFDLCDAIRPLVSARSEAVWVARQLLDALNRIEAASKLHFESTHIHGPDGPYCDACVVPWPCPTWLALNPKEAE